MAPKQQHVWSSSFGNDYTKRCQRTPQQLDEVYTTLYGSTRSSLNEEFLSKMSGAVSFLEVGCNIGNQLELLVKAGIGDLTGMDIQFEALRYAASSGSSLKLVTAGAPALPFKEGAFDVVFTSGVLIHIPPEHLKSLMMEMLRCSRRYIWGFEYYAPELTPLSYRGESDMLWKGDYATMFLALPARLRLVAKRMIPYCDVEVGKSDCMYLLEKY
jgi:pseudaminic acid biosynthesis-associated methylase